MTGCQSTPLTKCFCGVVRIRNQRSGADQKPRLEKMCLDLLNEAQEPQNQESEDAMITL